MFNSILHLHASVRPVLTKFKCHMQGGEWGSGAGKGGGGGGSIRDAGGVFGKMEVAREEEYFRRQQKKQIEDLKQHMEEEIKFHESQVKHHQEIITRIKNRSSDLDELKKNS